MSENAIQMPVASGMNSFQKAVFSRSKQSGRILVSFHFVASSQWQLLEDWLE